MENSFRTNFSIEYAIQVFLIQGGVQFNVVPAELCAGFDFRVTPTDGLEEFEEMLQRWCKEAGPGVTFEYIQKVKYLLNVILLTCDWEVIG